MSVDRDDWLMKAARHSHVGDWLVTHVAAFAVGVVFTLWLTGQL